jgi:hypothetical protein
MPPWRSFASRSNKIGRGVPDLAAIGQLWYSLITCFTLNPRQREEQASKTQIDQVRERQPKLLLVNIGSNEGLFRAAFLGAFDQQTLDSVAAIPKKMEPLADRLLPATVETIAFNSLVRPRTASNLMPGPNANRGGIYVGDGYYSTYGPWITGTAGSISGDTLKTSISLLRT